MGAEIKSENGIECPFAPSPKDWRFSSSPSKTAKYPGLATFDPNLGP